MKPISSLASRGARPTTVLALALFVLGACALALAARSQRPASGGLTLRFAHGGNAAVVPMELASNAVFVPVRIGQGQARSWLLDTGSAQTEVDTAISRATSVVGGDDTRVLALPGLAIRETAFRIRSFAPLGTWYGERVSGVVGDDVLDRLVARLDYARLSIELYAPEAYKAPRHSDKLSVRWVDGLPTVRARLRLGGRTVEGDFLLDTGGGAGVVVSPGFLASKRMYPYRGETIPGTIFSAGGEQKVSLTRGEWLQLGRARVKAPIVAIEGTKGTAPDAGARKAKGKNVLAGWIGGQVLRKFALLLDFPKDRVLLVPNRDFVFPIEADASGATIVATGPSLDQFEVHGVRPGTPAAQAGLEPGDRITWVDTDPASSLTLDELRQLLSRPGHSPVLVVRRLGRTLKIQVHLRRLL